MKSAQLIGAKSVVSMLGSLGRGTAYSKMNYAAILNAAPLGPATTISFDSAAFTPRTTGDVFVYVQMSVTASAVDDSLSAVLRVDTVAQPQEALASAGHVTAVAELSIGWIVTGLTLASHTFGIAVTDNTGGHTVSCADNEAIVVAIELF